VDIPHCVHDALPALEKLPASHRVHAVADALENDPAAQDEQVDTPDCALYVPGAHDRHADAAVLRYMPAWHDMHWVEPDVFV
jgi:hypothetical protein